MFALQVLAAVLLLLSAALFFGPQLVSYGPRAFPAILRQRQTRFVGGVLVTTSAFVVTAPHFGAAMVSGGERITLVAIDLFTMSFGLV